MQFVVVAIYFDFKHFVLICRPYLDYRKITTQKVQSIINIKLNLIF